MEQQFFIVCPGRFYCIHEHFKLMTTRCLKKIWQLQQMQPPACVLLQLQMTDAMDNLEELLHLSGGDGQIFTVEGTLCMKSVQAMFGYDWGNNVEKNCMFSCFMYLLRNLWPLYVFVCLRRLIDHAYSAFHAVLHCGNLSSDVQVFPRTEPVVIDEEVEPIPRSVSTGTTWLQI